MALEEASPTAIPGRLPRTGRETFLVQPFPRGSINSRADVPAGGRPLGWRYRGRQRRYGKRSDLLAHAWLNACIRSCASAR